MVRVHTKPEHLIPTYISSLPRANIDVAVGSEKGGFASGVALVYFIFFYFKVHIIKAEGF